MRYFVELMYDGNHYHGWQYQPNVLSVQETIEDALKKYLRKSTPVIGCGRTDTGVHASQYFIHFDVEENLEDHFLFRMNKILPHDIAFRKVYPVEENAHTRFAATSRSYRYQIYFQKNPFLRNYAFHYFLKDLDIEKMNEMCSIILDIEDFESLSKKGTDVKTTLCEVSHAQWEWEEELLVFNITANRFLRNMVRMIVGASLMIGQGKLDLNEFEQTVRAKKAFKYIMPVGPQGLYLEKIEYPFIE